MCCAILLGIPLQLQLHQPIPICSGAAATPQPTCHCSTPYSPAGLLSDSATRPLDPPTLDSIFFQAFTKPQCSPAASMQHSDDAQHDMRTRAQHTMQRALHGAEVSNSQGAVNNRVWHLEVQLCYARPQCPVISPFISKAAAAAVQSQWCQRSLTRAHNVCCEQPDGPSPLLVVLGGGGHSSLGSC